MPNNNDREPRLYAREPRIDAQELGRLLRPAFQQFARDEIDEAEERLVIKTKRSTRTDTSYKVSIKVAADKIPLKYSFLTNGKMKTRKKIAEELDAIFDMESVTEEEIYKYCNAAGEGLSKCNNCGKKLHSRGFVMMEIDTDRGEQFWYVCPECVPVIATSDKNKSKCKLCNTDRGYRTVGLKIVSSHHLEIRTEIAQEYKEHSEVCSNCRCKCENCGRVVRKDYKLIDATGCYDCVPVIKRNPYNYKPVIRGYITAKEEKKTNKVVGFELEVHTKNFQQPDVLNHWLIKSTPNFNKIFYTMYDGSIEPGIEFASYPFSENAYNNPDHMFNKTFNEVLTKLHDKIDTTAHDMHEACGMHIHINRKCLSTKTIFNILNFIYNNRQFMHIIAERDFERAGNRGHNSYSRFDANAKVRKAIEKRNNDKYTIVNFKPEYTIELRCFKSKLSRESIDKNIQFVFALIDWARDVSHRDSRDKDKFFAFVRQQPKRFGALLSFLSASKYL